LYLNFQKKSFGSTPR